MLQHQAVLCFVNILPPVAQLHGTTSGTHNFLLNDSSISIGMYFKNPKVVSNWILPHILTAFEFYILFIIYVCGHVHAMACMKGSENK